MVSFCFRSSASDETSILATSLLLDFPSRNRTKPNAATTRNPTRPVPISPLMALSNAITSQVCHRHPTVVSVAGVRDVVRVDAGEQVVFGKLDIHERAGQVVVLGRPDLPLQVTRADEEGAVGVDLGGVREQRLVAGLEVIAAGNLGGHRPLLRAVLPPGDPVGVGGADAA